MKNLIVALLGFSAILAVFSKADAAGFATSHLEISMARLQKDTDMGWADVTNLQIVSITGSPISTSKAQLGSFTTSGLGFNTLNALRSFGPTGLMAPFSTEDNFGSNSMLQSYTIGDTKGAGNLVDGLTMSTLADVNATGGQAGSSSGNIAFGGSFRVGVTGTYRLLIEAAGTLITSPMGTAGFAFGANINSTGIGTPLLSSLTPAMLNQVILGGNSISFAEKKFESTSFDLVENTTYSFNINQGSTASISSVPEPTSMAVIGILGAIGFASRRIGRQMFRTDAEITCRIR
jgi:hypothetical protein